jgi:hypothetical protein
LEAPLLYRQPVHSRPKPASPQKLLGDIANPVKFTASTRSSKSSVRV